jgi:hypothetical protein
MQVYIMLDENADGSKPVIALSTASREGEDLLKKLPSIDLLKDVRLRPFNFEGDTGDEVRGMEVTQQDAEGKYTVKVKNYFRDFEAKTNINGYPNPEGDTEDYSKDDWKLYFLQARKFLVNYTKENMQAAVAQAVIDRGTAVPQSAEQEARLRSEEEQTADEEFGEVTGAKIEPPSILKNRVSREEAAEPNPDDIPF